MRNFLERRDPWGNSPAVWIVAGLVFLTPLIWWSLKSLRFENELSQWLPADPVQQQLLTDAQTLFPQGDRILLTWDGSSLQDPRVEALVSKIEGTTDPLGIRRGGLPEIAKVVEPKSLLKLMQQQEVAPQDAAWRLHGSLLGAGPLKVRLTEAGRQRFRKTRSDLGKAFRKQFGVKIDMRDAVPDIARQAAIPGLPGEEAAETPPTSSPAVLSPSGQLIAAEFPVDHDLQLVWPGMAPGNAQTQEIVDFLRAFRGPTSAEEALSPPLIQDCFFVLGAPIALSLELSESGAADRHQTLETLRRTAELVGIPRESLKLGGVPVTTDALNRQALAMAWNPLMSLNDPLRRSTLLATFTAIVVITGLMVFSVRLAAIVLSVALYAACLSVAICTQLTESLTAATSFLPLLVFAATLAGGIHVVNLWKRAAARNHEIALGDLQHATLQPALLSGIGTTLICTTWCLNLLPPIRELGLMAAIGSVVSWLAIRYAVPSLLAVMPALSISRQAVEHRGWRELGGGLSKRPVPQAIAVLILCGVAIFGLSRARIETKIPHYFRDKSTLVKDCRFLEDQIGGLIPAEILIRFDRDAQETANFLQRQELVRTVEQRLRGHAELTGCLSLTDFLPPAELPERDAGLMATSRFHRKAAAAEGELQSGSIPEAERFYRFNPEEVATSSSPLLQSVWPGEEIWRISAQLNLMSRAEPTAVLAEVDRTIREVLRFQPGAQHVVTGSAMPFLVSQRAALFGLLRSLGLSLGIALVVLCLATGDLRAGLVSLLPTLLPIGIGLGIAGWSGWPIDWSGVFAAFLTVIVGLRGRVIWLTTYRRELADGISRPSAVMRAMEYIAPAIWQVCAVLGLSLLLFAPAELLLVSHFGVLAAVMIAGMLVCDLILLPQLIAGPCGAWLRPVAVATSSPNGLIHAAETIVPPSPHLALDEANPKLRVKPSEFGE